jgi:cytochrome c-type biogenesis protein CcmE
MCTRLRFSAMKAAFIIPVVLLFCLPMLRVDAGTATGKYSVLSPISKGKLAIFPVVAQITHDTSDFITLDDGIRSGDVVVTEAGNVNVRPLVRGQSHYVPDRGSGAQVNQLVLVNNSKHPLILLAGEIVTGGKQDRIIAKDRIIPVGGDPVDLSVFCVEPGRWTGTTTKFQAMSVPQMAQPSIRYNAMAEKSQQKVWDEVGRSRDRAMAAAAPRADGFSGAAVGGLASTTSYARTMQYEAVQKTVDEVAKPIQTSYDSIIRQLRDKHAVGVIVAVNGQIIWSDIFASTQLLEKYWPKLVRSYAAEAITSDSAQKQPSVATAEQFLHEIEGSHETIETDPGVYRQAETIGTNYRLFMLSALLPGTGYDLHISKMFDPSTQSSHNKPIEPLRRGHGYSQN